MAWIGGRTFDLFFFFGSSALAIAVGLFALAFPSAVVPLWLAWLLLVDGPHLLATYTRTYLDPSWRRDHRRLGWGSLLVFIPGPAALAITQVTHDAGPFDLYLLVATIWSFHHAVRQHYGILAIYQRHALPTPRERRIDSLTLYLGYWSLIALFLFGHPKSRLTLRLPEAIPPWANAILVVATMLIAAGLAAYALAIWARARRARDLRPALFLLLPVLGTLAFLLFVVGAAEPLFPHPIDPEQYFLAIAFTSGIVHGMQYLGIVLAANRRRHPRWRPSLTYVLLVAGSLAYLAINLLRGASPITLFSSGTLPARAFLTVYWGLFFHHYYLDQKIWRPHRDPVLRLELGLPEPAPSIMAPPGTRP